MGHGAGPVGDETAPRLADASGSLCGGLAHGRRAAVAERCARASSKRSGCWRCCGRAIRSSFTRGRRGRCSGAFATGGRGTASSPRCSSSKSPCPGREAAIDFTHATDLGVTIAGDPFPHLLFEFVLSYSHWTWVAIAFGETFEALVAGVQGALWALGGVPAVLRSDNLSAATHELKASSGRDLTPRFRAVLEHYGMRSSRITPGRAHENGVAEQAHRRLKSLIAQALLVRGHAAFDDVAAYDAFVQEVVAYWRNRPAAARLAEERPALRALPSAAIPSYTSYYPVVRRWSTIRVAHRTYSVPAQLMGHTVEARVHPNVVEVRYRDQVVQTMPRLRKEDEHRIDYRHVIGWLVRKPGAFARYRYREDLYPSITFRRAYDALVRTHGERADVEYLRILHLAATAGEARVVRRPRGRARSGRRLRLRHGASAGGAAGADGAGDPHSGAGPHRL